MKTPPDPTSLRLLFIANPNSTHTRRWVEWFFQRGHTVALVADAPLHAAWESGEIFDLAKQFNLRMIRYVVWVWQLRAIIRRWRPDIVHAHRVSSAGWLGAFSGFHPLVVTPWGSDLYQHPGRSALAGRLARFTLQRADLVTADSQDLRRLAIHFGADPSTSHEIQWGVDRRSFFPAGKPAAWKDRLGIQDEPVLLSPRGVNRIYNLDVIVRAFARVRAVYPRAVLILRAVNVDLDYQHEIEQLVETAGLSANVRWAPEIEPYPEVAGLYRLADVVVSLASSDGTPVSVLEALACGVPVIASDLASLREWIEDGVNGRLVPTQDPELLAARVIELLGNPSLRKQFASLGPRLIAEKADQVVEMAKMERLYQDLVS